MLCPYWELNGILKYPSIVLWGSWYDLSCSLVSFINLCSLVFNISIIIIAKSSLWFFLWRIKSVSLSLFRLVLLEVYFVSIKMVVLSLISGLFTWNIFLPPFSLRGCMSLMIKGGSWIKQKDKSCLYIYSLSIFIWNLRLLMWKNINEVFAGYHYFVVIIIIRFLLLLLWW